MFPDSKPEPLFSRQDLRSVLQGQTKDMLAEIQSYDPNQLLNTSTERLLDYFVEKYSVEVPVLQEDGSSVRAEDVQITGKGAFSGESRPLSATRYHIRVPFTGDPRLFNSSPSTMTTIRPKARIESDGLIFVYEQTAHDAAALDGIYNRDLASVRQYLQWISEEVGNFNSQIRPQASTAVEARRTKLLNDQGVAASLGIPLERGDLPATYAAPEIRRKPTIVRPKASTDPYVPEPELEMVEYEHILEVIRGTALVIERNPSTFTDATEPMIRDHFLVQLNGHYSGGATGETFNSHGKSDILVRSGDRNVFIAELKFWDGAKSITDALNQLLTRYTAWRDSKIALIVLNRRRDFSAVLDQVPGAIEACDKVIRRLAMTGDTDSRYLLQHPDDPNKELMLTVMCFEVPPKEAKTP